MPSWSACSTPTAARSMSSSLLNTCSESRTTSAFADGTADDAVLRLQPGRELGRFEALRREAEQPGARLFVPRANDGRAVDGIEALLGGAGQVADAVEDRRRSGFEVLLDRGDGAGGEQGRDGGHLVLPGDVGLCGEGAFEVPFLGVGDVDDRGRNPR